MQQLKFRGPALHEHSLSKISNKRSRIPLSPVVHHKSNQKAVFPWVDHRIRPRSSGVRSVKSDAANVTLSSLDMAEKMARI